MSKDKRQLRAEAVERLKKLRRTDYIWDDVIEAMLAERDPRYTIVSQLIDLLSDDEQPETFHDDFYDCESTVDAGEDTREKLEADACTFVAWAWEAGRNYERRDSNTRFEGVAWSGDELIDLLDRQAAITEREGREAWHKAASGEIYQAKQEADELRRRIRDGEMQFQHQVDDLQAERDELRRQVSELRELNDSLHARIESAREALS